MLSEKRVILQHWLFDDHKQIEDAQNVWFLYGEDLITKK